MSILFYWNVVGIYKMLSVRPREIQFHIIKYIVFAVHLQFLFNCQHCPHFTGRESEAGKSKVVCRRSHTFKQHSCEKDIAAWHLLWAIKTCSSQGGEDHSAGLKQISRRKWATFQRHWLLKMILKETESWREGRSWSCFVLSRDVFLAPCPYHWWPISNARCDKLCVSWFLALCHL